MSATGLTVRPGDFPIGSPESRAAARALVQARTQSPKVGLRLILDTYDSLDLDKSTCRRALTGDGTVTEIVCLHGSAKDISDAELQAFIARHPIAE